MVQRNHLSKRRATNLISRSTGSLIIALVVVLFSAHLSAQTGGEAGIQGTVTDSEGAAIPNATVTVTNDATGVAISRQTNGGGLYTVSPILPGIYTVQVKAQGFSDYIQRNLTANALVMTSLNIPMKVGATNEQVEVTAAPPQLITTNASLGLTSRIRRMPIFRSRSTDSSAILPSSHSSRLAPPPARGCPSSAVRVTISDSSISMGFPRKPSASRAITVSSRSRSRWTPSTRSRSSPALRRSSTPAPAHPTSP